MRKQFFLCLFILTVCVSCGRNSDKVRIAIITPTTHPSLEQMEKGFIQTVSADKSQKYRFDTYNALGNKTLLRSEIEEVFRKDYALVLTIGTSASQMTVEVFSKKASPTPIVFTAVNDPEAFHILGSETVTGVKELVDYRSELAFLKKLKPDLKTVLLVYNPSEAGLEKDQREVSRILKEMGIALLTVEVFNVNEIQAKVAAFIEKADALLVLKDNCVVSGLSVLVKFAEHYKIPLMASDLDSPDNGAAFAFGVPEIDYGIEAGKKALLILNEGVSTTKSTMKSGVAKYL